MASASAAGDRPGEIQEREMPTSASFARSSNSNGEPKKNVEQKDGVDASGGPLLGKAEESIKFGTVHNDNGDFYEGELKDGRGHGRGKLTWNGGSYDGEWKDGIMHGTGTFTWANGDVYEGQWMKGTEHGKGTMEYSSGDIYEGMWNNGQKTQGKMTFANGSVYEGSFMGGIMHGRGAMKWPSENLYEGEWKDDKQHGRGTVKWKNGDIYEGEWAGGQKTRGTMTWANGERWTGRFSHNGNATGTLDPPCEPPIERKLRSQKSQQRRLQNSTRATKACEHCGVDDYRYRLRACSGCNLALYCSTACQKAASGSHRRICDIISELPSKDADRLILKYDKEKANDLDAGLRYGTKYMDNLKHLEIDLEAMAKNESVKLSPKQLSSLLKQKRGALDSVFWLSNDCIQTPNIGGHDTVWKELHGLKQLYLEFMGFDDVQSICDIIDRQRKSLLVLCLPFLIIDWHKAKCRRTFAQAVNSCKHLVKLELNGCVLMDSDLKVMLQNLPNLRNLHLRRDTDHSHDFTDNTCGLIARKCPGLQELNLDYHNQLSVRGIRKIFEGCIHLRMFFTTTPKLSGKDIQSSLDIAPQLMYLSVADGIDISEVDLSKIVEATGGRTVLQRSSDRLFEPDGVSARTKEKYESQKYVLGNVWKRQRDPEVANEWAGWKDDVSSGSIPDLS